MAPAKYVQIIRRSQKTNGSASTKTARHQNPKMGNWAERIENSLKASASPS